MVSGHTAVSSHSALKDDGLSAHSCVSTLSPQSDGLRAHSSDFTLCPQERSSQEVDLCHQHLQWCATLSLAQTSCTCPFPIRQLTTWLGFVSKFNFVHLTNYLLLPNYFKSKTPPKNTINQKTKPTFLELCVLNIVNNIQLWVAGFLIISLLIVITWPWEGKSGGFQDWYRIIWKVHLSKWLDRILLPGHWSTFTVFAKRHRSQGEPVEWTYILKGNILDWLT